MSNGENESRIFLAIGAALAVGALIYAASAYEEAGTVMLVVAAAMALLIGGWLSLQARRRTDPAEARPSGADEDVVVDEAELYLPHSSVWPFGLGMGTVLMVNGLALGLWAMLPGAAVAAYCTWGYARQSRRRD